MKSCSEPNCARPVFTHGFCKSHAHKYYNSRVKKVKKVKKKTRGQLVKELDRVFSIFIRQRGMDARGFNRCYTCGTRAHWSDLQCGHFISRRHYPTRWDEKNCKPQDAKCNIFNQGNAPVFAANLIEEYGASILNLLLAKKNNLMKITNTELEILIDDYKSKHFKELSENKK